MRRAFAVLAFLALVLVPADAADPATEPSFGRHVVSGRSQVGDWTTYEAILTPATGERNAKPLRFLVTYRLKRMVAHGFELEIETDPPSPGQAPTFVISSSSEKLRDLLRIGSDVKIEDGRMEPDTRVVDGHTFPCKKIDFLTTEGTVIQQNTIWFSDQLNVLRMIALSCRPSAGTSRPLGLEMEVRGHGHAGSTVWGSTAKELAQLK